MALSIGILAFVFGATIGSFLNVVILRTHTGHNIRGRSACPHCHKPLRWWELIPILSYIFLGGHCQRCHRRLSPQYPIVELLTALIFLDLVVWLGVTPTVLAAAVVAVGMILISVYDFRWSAIPDHFTAVLGIGAIAFVLLRPMPLIDAAIGAAAGAIFFGAQYFLSRKRWVGSGDIFLAAALGILLGWRMLGLALFLAYMIGTVVALVMLLRKRLKLDSAIPFGPFLLAGAYLSWHWGETIVNWYFGHALFQ